MALSILPFSQNSCGMEYMIAVATPCMVWASDRLPVFKYSHFYRTNDVRISWHAQATFGAHQAPELTWSLFAPDMPLTIADFDGSTYASGWLTMMIHVSKWSLLSSSLPLLLPSLSSSSAAAKAAAESDCLLPLLLSLLLSTSIPCKLLVMAARCLADIVDM